MPAHILIIEDDPPSRELMAYLLESHGHAAQAAGDGINGLRQARETHPDMVICDLHLPGIDGYAVAAALRADPAFAHTALVAVSALAMDGDRERVLAAGFDGYLCKPIEPDSFVAEVEAFLPEPAGTLLLVDDDAFMLDVLVDTLEGERYRILAARSAEEALVLLERNEVQVILSDQCMPGLQGTELMERISLLRPRTVRLILSGESEWETIERACAAGLVDRHYAKPWDGSALREQIRAAFRLQRERARAPA